MGLPGVLGILEDKLGTEVALEVGRCLAGERLRFPPLRDLDCLLRNLRIHQEFDGTNIEALAKKYNVSTRTIRRIVSRNY